MGIEAEFLRDSRLIIVHFVGILDLGEYRQFVQKTHRAVYDSAQHSIHSILDLTQAQGLPRNVISNALSLSKLKHINDGLIYFVINEGLKARFIEVFLSMTRDPNHRITRTVEEAITQIDTALEQEQHS